MEDSNDRPVVEEKVKSRPRKKNLYKQILKQMEFYFGDVNLSKDRYLSQLLAKNKKVPIEVFLSFNKIKTLTTDLQDVVNALGRSEMLKVSKDGLKVFRITPIARKENEVNCTVYVEQLPPDATHDWVKNVFSAYGNVDYVSIPKYKNKQAIKGFAFVEYSTPEEAQKVLEAFGSAGCCLPSQMLPEELCSIATYQEQESEVQEEGNCEEQEPISSSNEANLAEADDTEESSEKKTKKRKRKRSEGTEEETALAASAEEESKEEKKRKREEHLEQEEEEEEEAGTEEQETRKKKKKKKKEMGGDNEGLKEAGQEDEEECEQEERKRKKRKLAEEEDGKTEEKGELEDSEEQEPEEKNEDEESEKKVKKKKNRKRTQKGKKKKEDSTFLGLRIMSKVEWLRLRSKYLNLQREKLGALKRMRRENMDAVKKRMRKSQWGSNYQSPTGERQEAAQEAAARRNPRSTPMTFVPGIILHVDLPEPVTNGREFQSMVKTHQDIAYVDIEEGSTKMYLRLVSAPAAHKLLADRPWEKMVLLEGKEEKQYWDKLFQKRKEILENNKLRGRDKQMKMRGRDKLLKQAESELGKHIKFDEGDD